MGRDVKHVEILNVNIFLSGKLKIIEMRVGVINLKKRNFIEQIAALG
jgi:hypothetical protein